MAALSDGKVQLNNWTTTEFLRGYRYTIQFIKNEGAPYESAFRKVLELRPLVVKAVAYYDGTPGPDFPRVPASRQVQIVQVDVIPLATMTGRQLINSQIPIEETLYYMGTAYRGDEVPGTELADSEAVRSATILTDQAIVRTSQAIKEVANATGTAVQHVGEAVGSLVQSRSLWLVVGGIAAVAGIFALKRAL